MGMGEKSAHAGVAPAGDKVVISMFLSSSTSFFSELESLSSEEFSTESLSNDSSSEES